MAERRRGRKIDGWLAVDKPAGITSAAVVSRVRRATGAAQGAEAALAEIGGGFGAAGRGGSRGAVRGS